MAEHQNAIIAGLSGGLGNQLFQYAAARALSIKLNLPLKLDVSWFSNIPNRNFALTPYSIEAEICEQNHFIPNFLRPYINRFSKRYCMTRMGSIVFRERNFAFNETFNNISSPVFLEGYWQSEKYFKDASAHIHNDFILKEPISSECRSILDEINNSHSICVHIRRGDYVSDPLTAQTHGTCSLEYYEHNVAELARMAQTPHCFVFSDDCQWVRDNLNLSCPSTIVDIHTGDEAHLDLFLMSSCQDFIIANSSLSWWAAWLGKHKQKKVIAPKQWFLNSDKDTKDLIPASWERK